MSFPSFEASIDLSCDRQVASAKSIMGVLTLCAGFGAKIQVTAVGADAEAAIRSIAALFHRGFHEPADSPADAATMDTMAQPEAKGDTILVVDDEASIRDMVKRMLRSSGFQAVMARSGVEAIAFLTANGGAVKAVILDLMMPEMGGLDALSAIRRMHPDLPVLLTSGAYDRPPVDRDGPTAFLRKPFGKAELIPVLRTLLEGGGRQRVGDRRQEANRKKEVRSG